MMAAKARGKHLGRPSTSIDLVTKIEKMARTTDLSVRQIYLKIDKRAGRGVVGNIVKRVRSNGATG
jgi:hypothetical protein